MSSDIPNLDRVGPAAVAIAAYVDAVSKVGRDYDRTVDESLLDAIADLLTDLRHYCANALISIDFDALVARSAARFAEEVAEAGVQELNTGEAGQ